MPINIEKNNQKKYSGIGSCRCATHFVHAFEGILMTTCKIESG